MKAQQEEVAALVFVFQVFTIPYILAFEKIYHEIIDRMLDPFFKPMPKRQRFCQSSTIGAPKIIKGSTGKEEPISSLCSALTLQRATPWRCSEKYTKQTPQK